MVLTDASHSLVHPTPTVRPMMQGPDHLGPPFMPPGPMYGHSLHPLGMGGPMFPVPGPMVGPGGHVHAPMLGPGGPMLPPPGQMIAGGPIGGGVAPWSQGCVKAGEPSFRSTRLVLMQARVFSQTVRRAFFR